MRSSQLPELSLYANACHVSKGIAANNTSTQLIAKAPAYTVVDIGSATRLIMANTSSPFVLGINNLFDEQYWQAGSGVLSIGASRVYSFSAKYDW